MPPTQDAEFPVRAADRRSGIPRSCLARVLRGVFLAGCLSGCTALQFTVANVSTSSQGVVAHTDLAYAAGARRSLDVYTAAGASERPVVVFWYGGSWETGRKEDYRFVGRTLARRGFVAILPDYRLFPEVRFPQFEEDGARALAWVQAHARDYGGDPRRIVLMGHSAGAHTAAFLAFNHEYVRQYGVDPAAIAGLVGLSGPYELVPDSDHLRAAFATPYTPRDWQPIRFVDDRSPPSLLLHGLADREVVPQESIDLSHALEQHRVPVELHLYPHRRHGATVAPFASIMHGRTPVVEQTVAFISRLPAVAPAAPAP